MPLELKPLLRQNLQPCPLERGKTYFLGVGTEILDASRSVQPEQAIVAPQFAAIRMLHSRPVDEQLDFVSLSAADA